MPAASFPSRVVELSPCGLGMPVFVRVMYILEWLMATAPQLQA